MGVRRFYTTGFRLANMPLLPFLVSSNVSNGNWLCLDKKSVQKRPAANRRKTGCLADHSRAPQPFPISLDSNQTNDLTNLAKYVVGRQPEKLKVHPSMSRETAKTVTEVGDQLLVTVTSLKTKTNM